MTLTEWLNVVPSAMSAIAAVAAAYAAFVALKVSKKSNSLSEKSILAAHHHGAVSVLSNSIEMLRNETKEFSEFSYNFWVDWSREIELKDQPSSGGLDPRPLRHVLSNGCEMLVAYATRNGKQHRNARRAMFSIVREGVNGLNEREYNGLLKKADGTYGNFECALGSPPLNKGIEKSDAFRWVYYQLMKRINRDEWNEIWRNALLTEGWITRYRAEFSKVQPILEQVFGSLQVEKKKIAFSVLPLQSNTALHTKYEKVLSGLEVILDDCSLESLDSYEEGKHNEEVVQLILYSMGTAYLVMNLLESICLLDDLDM